MVYHYRTTRCPSCGEIAERVRTVDSEILKGTPFRICPHCHETYFDREYNEIGIVLFEEKGGEMNIWSILWALFSSSIFIVTLFSGIKEGFHGLALPLSIFGVIAGLFDYGFIRALKLKRNQEVFHLSQIEYIEGRGRERPQSLIESMARLSDKEYLDALKSHGVIVPDYFYQRLKSQMMEAAKKDTAVDGIVKQAASHETSPKIQFCRECGARLNDGSSFCSECGTPIIPTAQKEQRKENDGLFVDKSDDNCAESVSLTKNFEEEHFITAEENEVRFCHRCGYRLKDNSVFCSHCGTKIE